MTTGPEADTTPRAAVRGVATGLLLMAFFTALWASWVIPGFPLAVAVPTVAVFLVAVVAFAVNGVVLLRAAGRFPMVDTAERQQRTRSVGAGFGALFGAEGVVIGVSCGALGATGHAEYIAPVMALVVGLHFLPMARLFGRTFDYYVGTWVILVALAGGALIATGAVATNVAGGLVGVATACGTAAYGIYMIAIKRSLLATREPALTR